MTNLLINIFRFIGRLLLCYALRRVESHHTHLLANGKLNDLLSDIESLATVNKIKKDVKK